MRRNIDELVEKSFDDWFLRSYLSSDHVPPEYMGVLKKFMPYIKAKFWGDEKEEYVIVLLNSHLEKIYEYDKLIKDLPYDESVKSNKDFIARKQEISNMITLIRIAVNVIGTITQEQPKTISENSIYEKDGFFDNFFVKNVLSHIPKNA